MSCLKITFSTIFSDNQHVLFDLLRHGIAIHKSLSNAKSQSSTITNSQPAPKPHSIANSQPSPKPYSIANPQSQSQASTKPYANASKPGPTPTRNPLQTTTKKNLAR